MASVYDAILVRGKIRYRLNKVFVGEEKIPPQVKEVLTTNNIVDENGMVIVDQKNEAAQKPTEENASEVGDGESTKLPRIDGDGGPAADPDPAPEKPDNAGGDQPSNLDERGDPINPSQPSSESSTPPSEQPSAAPAPVDVDDSANEDDPELSSDDDKSDGKKEEGEDDDGEKTDTENSPVPEPEKPKPAPIVADPAEEPEPAPRPKPRAPVGQPPAQVPSGPVERFRSKVPQSTPGMGFPRKNGRTVDIFDGTTPHTHVKLVGGHAVPLSLESFRTRTEGEIMARLKELGFDIVDFNEIERKQAMAGVAPQPGGANLLLEDEERDDDIQLG